jgi:hypothetical protein
VPAEKTKPRTRLDELDNRLIPPRNKDKNATKAVVPACFVGGVSAYVAAAIQVQTLAKTKHILKLGFSFASAGRWFLFMPVESVSVLCSCQPESLTN